MKYTAIISNSNGFVNAGLSIEETVVVEAERINDVVGEAQVIVASRILEELCGEGSQPNDYEDLWMQIYDHIPVVAIIEGEPKVIINDEIYE